MLAETMGELRDGLQAVVKLLTQQSDSKITSVSSGCELFLRFITLKVCLGDISTSPQTTAKFMLTVTSQASHVGSFGECKRQLVASGIMIVLLFYLLLRSSDCIRESFVICLSGKEYLERATQGRGKIAKKGLPFIRDGTVCSSHCPFTISTLARA
jgi:hypothetical protein